MTKHVQSYTSGASDKPLLGLTIGEMFDQIVEQYPDNEALVVGHQNLRYTYRELQQQVNQCARGLLATGLLGLLGVWSVGMLGRRLAGPWVGLLGALFLALNGVQVWFSRYSTSEACAQFLGFAALYGFVVMQGSRVRGQEAGVSSESEVASPLDALHTTFAVSS